MKDLGPVETRITVLPRMRRPEDKKKSSLLHSPPGLRMPLHIRPPAIPPKRNSIGETLPPSIRPGAPTPAQGRTPNSVGPTVTARGGEAPGNPSAAPGNAALAPLRARPIMAAPAAPRSTINGSGIARRSSAPLGIGGQAKPAAGVNGSEIRPKH